VRSARGRGRSDERLCSWYASGIDVRPGERALITGAGGFIGGHLARRLAEEGWRVRAVVRDPARALLDLQHPSIEVVRADVLDADAMRAAAEDATSVVHAAGPTRLARRAAVWRTGVEGTRTLYQAARESSVRQFVLVSSFAVYSNCRSPYDERSALTACGDAYADAKMAAEEVLLRARDGPAVAVLRPPAVYGPGSWYWSTRLAQAAIKRRLFVPGGGLFPIVYTFVDNLADAVLAVMARAATGVFNVFDGAMSYLDFVRPYAEMAGTRPRPLPLPALRSLAATAATSLRALGWWTPLSPTLLGFLVEGHRHAPERPARARAELGWAPRVGYREGVERTQRWLCERGLLH
jgi:nucleoside-diphosphate-sugar epimerase